MNKQEAIATGSARYETGEPCIHGHIDERYTSNGDCVQCHRARNLLDHFSHKEIDPMITMNEQIASLEKQLDEVRDRIGRPPPEPVIRIPRACCTSQSFSIARLIAGKCGVIRDDELHTKISVTEEARKIAMRSGLPIRYLSWEVDLANVTGPDAVLIVERLHVTTDQGDNGRRPVTRWTFSNAPPTWLKFDDTEVLI